MKLTMYVGCEFARGLRTGFYIVKSKVDVGMVLIMKWGEDTVKTDIKIA